MSRCFKCEKPVHSSLQTEDTTEEEIENHSWEIPLGGISFQGGSNYGSTLYDSMIPNEKGERIEVQLVVCDVCTKKAVQKGLMREVVLEADIFIRKGE